MARFADIVYTFSMKSCSALYATKFGNSLGLAL